jgi:hypothetical protein
LSVIIYYFFHQSRSSRPANYIREAVL